MGLPFNSHRTSVWGLVRAEARIQEPGEDQKLIKRGVRGGPQRRSKPGILDLGFWIEIEI